MSEWTEWVQLDGEWSRGLWARDGVLVVRLASAGPRAGMWFWCHEMHGAVMAGSRDGYPFAPGAIRDADWYDPNEAEE